MNPSETAAPDLHTAPATGEGSLDPRALLAALEAVRNAVQPAFDGVAAISAAESFKADVVLLDIGLPELNGYQVARQIRQQAWGRDILLVAVTGWGQDDDRRLARDAGFDAHLVKPVGYRMITRLFRGAPPSEWATVPSTRLQLDSLRSGA